MTAKSEELRPPRAPHGRRLLIPQIDGIAHAEPDRPWIAVPVDSADLSRGYRDITFKQFANAVNAAAHWLREHLGLSIITTTTNNTATQKGVFPAFAYAGPSDYSHALFAAAAGKLGYQIIPFAKSIGPPGQLRIMRIKECTVYLYSPDQASVAHEVKKLDPAIRVVRAPQLEEELMADVAVEPIPYDKSWEDAHGDPWIVFHTSGTTGPPKVITYSQQKLSTVDIVMGLEDDEIGDTTLAQYVDSRIYLPLPPTHYVSLLMTLSCTVWARVVPVYGPGGIVPSPAIVKGVMQHGRIDGAILVPALIDALCQDPESLDLLRQLNYIQYAGAPLGTTSGRLLSSHVRIVPAIGSTDSGGYFVRLPNVHEDWDYVELQPHTGAVMEHRVDGMHELVFVRDRRCAVQSMFEGRGGTESDSDRFETKDLWVEHPTKKGQWKIVGRSDDLVKLADGLPVFVAGIEAALSEHPLVKNALVVGHGKPRLVVLVEPVDTAIMAAVGDDHRQTTTEVDREQQQQQQQQQQTQQKQHLPILTDLQHHIEKVNDREGHHHPMAQLDPRLIVVASADKPWPRTIKGTPIRSQVERLYEWEIEDVCRHGGHRATHVV